MSSHNNPYEAPPPHPESEAPSLGFVNHRHTLLSKALIVGPSLLYITFLFVLAHLAKAEVPFADLIFKEGKGCLFLLFTLPAAIYASSRQTAKRHRTRLFISSISHLILQVFALSGISVVMMILRTIL